MAEAVVETKEKKELPEICINSARVRRVLEIIANKHIIDRRAPYKDSEHPRTTYNYVIKCTISAFDDLKAVIHYTMQFSLFNDECHGETFATKNGNYFSQRND